MLSKCWRHWSRKIHLPASRESLNKKCLSSGWNEAQVWRLWWREMVVLHCAELELTVTTAKAVVQTSPKSVGALFLPSGFQRILHSCPGDLCGLCVACALCDPFIHMGHLGCERVACMYVRIYAQKSNVPTCGTSRSWAVWSDYCSECLEVLDEWPNPQGDSDLGKKVPDSEVFWDIWTDTEGRSRVVWAAQAGGRGIIPREALGKNNSSSGKGGWQKQKGLPSFVGRYG